MKKILQLRVVWLAVVTAVSATSLFASPVLITQEFPGGFNVSVNGGPLAPSGPITVRGIVDTTTLDINPDSGFGEFPLISATFTGAGFLNRPITTPLSLVTFTTFGPENFSFQLTGQFNQGIIGWNGSNPSGSFMGDINNLSTLVSLPYSTVGSSTFWYDALGAKAWTLALGGETVGANLGSSGPDGIFSITAVPEPCSLALSVLVLISAGVWGRRRGR